MDFDDKIKAFTMAKEAAKLDFGSAMEGLMAGHQAVIEDLRERLEKSDYAFLMALVTSDRSVRFARESNVGKVIADYIKERGGSLCKAEEKFIERNGG